MCHKTGLYALIFSGLILGWSNGFHHYRYLYHRSDSLFSQEQRRDKTYSRFHGRKAEPTLCASSTVLCGDQRQSFDSEKDNDSNVIHLFVSGLETIATNGLDTVATAGLKHRDVLTAGGGGIFMFGVRALVRRAKAIPQDIENLKNLPQNVRSLTWKNVKPIKRIQSLHGPVTYLILSFFLAKKYNSLLKNMIFWLWNAFCIKWFRARYVYKIPVWDRQPNWNNVITSKEQEKDLKAFTCKTCGSTLFIAKTREFFFEGSTGIGGLGCFSCGAKGKDNFVMDRDRIVEDVADIDDYFEYERPLDFISAADRRALLKEAGGDEDKANQILIERDTANASEESQNQAESIVNGTTDAVMKDKENEVIANEDGKKPDIENDDDCSEISISAETHKELSSSGGSPLESEKKPKKLLSSSSLDEDEDLDLLDLDLLDMDDF